MAEKIPSRDFVIKGDGNLNRGCILQLRGMVRENVSDVIRYNLSEKEVLIFKGEGSQQGLACRKSSYN